MGKYNVLERSTYLQLCSRMRVTYPKHKKNHLLLKLLAMVLLVWFNFSEKSYKHSNIINLYISQPKDTP